MYTLPTKNAIFFLPLALAACAPSEEEKAGRADLAKVVRGPLTISVTESAEIKAARSTRVMNEMEGNSTIIYLIPEGSIVEKGEKLVQLDNSQQIEKRATQEIAVEKAKAAVINAKKSLDILEDQVESEKRAAETNVKFAEMDKQKFFGELLADGKREMGEREQQIKDKEAEIALADSAYKLALDRYKWSVKLREKDFITKEDLDKDKLDLESKETRLALAQNDLKILQKYTLVKTQQELDLKLEEAKLELRRTVAKGEAELTQAIADLRSKEAEEKLATERLENLERQIKNSTVVAPTPGIVVYATEGDRFRRKTIELGTQVRERQVLINLPDTTKMQAELKVQEVVVDKIRPGLPSLIRIDTQAAPLVGSVLKRAPLPDSNGRMSNPDLKEYKTTVSIDSDNKDNALRPNMSATVEIVIAQLENVIYVPQAAVFSQGAVNYAWVETPAGPVATEITTGEHNESYVVIEKGLAPDQMVYLAQPPGVQEPEFKQPDKPKVDPAIARLAADASAEGGPVSAQMGGRRQRAPNGRGRGEDNGEDNGEVNGEDPPGGVRRRGGRRDGDETGEREGSARRGGAGGGRGGFNSPAMTEYRKAQDDFKAVVKSKNPGLHAKIEEAGMRWTRNAEITAEITADTSLADAYAVFQAARQKLMGSFPGRGGGEGERGGERGGRRGGDGESGGFDGPRRRRDGGEDRLP